MSYQVIVILSNEFPESDEEKAHLTDKITVALENVDLNVSSVQFGEDE